MASVADLVEPDALRERAGEYLERAGTVLRGAGAVRIVAFGPLRVSAEVADGSSRSVTLESTPGGLRSSCTCESVTEDGLCPHVVATAIETWHAAPKRR